MGSGYLLEHITSCHNREIKAQAYKDYIAECLRFISKNTAHPALYFSGGNEEIRYMNISVRDLFDGTQQPEDTRTADEIINDVLGHFGGKEAAE